MKRGHVNSPVLADVTRYVSLYVDVVWLNYLKQKLTLNTSDVLYHCYNTIGREMILLLPPWRDFTNCRLSLISCWSVWPSRILWLDFYSPFTKRSKHGQMDPLISNMFSSFVTHRLYCKPLRCPYDFSKKLCQYCGNLGPRSRKRTINGLSTSIWEWVGRHITIKSAKCYFKALGRQDSYSRAFLFKSFLSD